MGKTQSICLQCNKSIVVTLGNKSGMCTDCCVKTRSRLWQKENSERYRELLKAWRVKNPEYNLEWQRDNLEQYKALLNNRRVREILAEGRCTNEELFDLLVSHNFKCAYCNACILDGYHLDHIIPISKGGSGNIDNIQPLCSTCNLRKLAKYPWEYERTIGFVRPDGFYNNRKLYTGDATHSTLSFAYEHFGKELTEIF